MPAIDHHDIRLDATIGRRHHRAIAGTLCGLHSFCEMDRIPSRPDDEPLLILLACDVLEIGNLVVGVVAVFVGDFAFGWTVPEEHRGNQAVNGELSGEPIAGQGDVESPIFHLDGLKNLAGLGVANLPLI